MTNEKLYHQWARKLRIKKDKAPYLMIADFIAESVGNGRLKAKDRLPTVRQLSSILELNYATVAKGYAQAKESGLIDSRPGSGSFIKEKKAAGNFSHDAQYNLQMNAPVPIESVELIQKMKQSAAVIVEDQNILSILRYQNVLGSEAVREAGAQWIKKRIDGVAASKIIPCAGIHSALVALFSLFGKSGEICTPAFFYPGIKAISQQLNISVFSVDSDDEGPLPESFDNACKKRKVSAIYLNPTINNPTTVTMPLERRIALADIARKHGVSIIEDDAYGMLPINAIASCYEILPEMTWYITGMSKCFAPGLRMAWIHAPSVLELNAVAASMRALTLMPNPLTNALVAQWIADGVADRALVEMRREAGIRQDLARQVLAGKHFTSDSAGFHLWLELPADAGVHSLEVAAKLQSLGVSAISSYEFSFGNPTVNAIRLCLGGDHQREECAMMLQSALKVIENPTWYSSVTI